MFVLTSLVITIIFLTFLFLPPFLSFASYVNLCMYSPFTNALRSVCSLSLLFLLFIYFSVSFLFANEWVWLSWTKFLLAFVQFVLWYVFAFLGKWK
jgi:hypothetical protein